MRILVVEDDVRTADYIRHGLIKVGHLVEVLDDGTQALACAGSGSFDVILMDRLLPGMDGLSVVKALRASGITTPVLFLTAINGLDDRVEGLESGGDDYLVKPFALSELLARINALARRLPVPGEKTALRLWDLELDLVRHSCKRGTVAIDLLPREFTLLEYLMRNENRIVTRTMLLEKVWDFHFDPKTSVVETHISRLRAKIDKPFDRALLHTIRLTGYTMHA
ncbi:response regulator [Devosia sp.]|uniref:response regulator n=1 Tax=Devosia sp. TaxID=1871048 RepID=UPI003264D669